MTFLQVKNTFDYEDYGFYCDVEDVHSLHNHGKFNCKIKKDKTFDYDLINTSDYYYSDDNHISYNKRDKTNNETLNECAKRSQIFINLSFGCIFVVTSCILFLQR